MDRLCDWVHRYNKLGLQDPFDRSRRNGPVIALSTEPVVCRSSAVRRGMAGSRPRWSFRAALQSLECRRSAKCGGSRSDVGRGSGQWLRGLRQAA